MIVLSAPNGGKGSDWLRPSPCTLYRSTLNGGKASDWMRPFPTDGRVANYHPKGLYQSSNGYSNGVHLLSILPAFPQVRGKPDHISSQGKEAIFAMHDIYNIGTRSSTKASGEKPPEVHGADKPLDPNLKPEHQSKSKIPSIVGTKTPTKSPTKIQTPKRYPRKSVTISKDPPEEIPVTSYEKDPLQDLGDTHTHIHPKL